MKALSSILGMCIVLASVASCGKDDAQNEITFKAVVHKSTKAPITHSWYAMTDPEFGIYAFRSEGGQSSLYISNARCTNDKNPENLWYTTPTSYWPASGTLTFMAYSPFMASGVSCDGNSLTVDSFDISSQDDLLYTIAADATGLTAASAGAQYGYDDGASTTATGVPIRFRHALSLVEVRVKTDSPGSNIVVTGIKFSGFNRYGVATTNNSGAVWSQKAGSYSPVIFSGEQGVTVSSSPIGSMHLFIPTTLASSHKLLVSYKIAAQDIYGNVIPEGGGTVTDYPVDLSNSTLSQWEPGKKYILTLNINAKQMTFTASANNWEDSNGEINL